VIARHVKLKMNKKLKKQLERHLWHLTGCYNWAIKTIEARKDAGQPYSEFDILNLLSGHSKKSGVSSRALAGAVNDAFGAWQKCWSKQNGKPRLKGERNKLNSIQFRGDCHLYSDTNEIKLPNFGRVRFHRLTRGFPSGKLASTVRLVKKASGWYAVILFNSEHTQALISTSASVGIDTGFKNLIITSDGQKFEHPRELEASASQLARVQRGNSKKKTARLQERISNRRKDRNHKISHEIVKNYANIFITNDNLKGQAKVFGKSIASSGIGQLRHMIFYKGSSCGRKVIFVASKNSTLSCSNCGGHTGPTGLKNLNVRNWECATCGVAHDRDINAAINTLNSGARYALESSKDGVSRVKDAGNSWKSLD
jgi:putative transposase